MKKQFINASMALLAAGLLASCNNNNNNHSGGSGMGPNGLPQDVKVTCPLDSAEFNSWFKDGVAKENGFVNPANSVDFTPDSNCNFYRWSEQMFLWITSHDELYGTNRGKLVLESPVFYTVGPDTSNNENQGRILIPHSEMETFKVMPHVRKTGPNKLDVITTKDGRIMEIEPAHPQGKMMAKTADGKLVTISQVQKTADGRHLFLDDKNQPVTSPRAHIVKGKGANIVQLFKTAEGENVFLDANGNEVEAESGQATHQVLVAQNGSVVYYLLFVNDVFAFYQAGVTSPNKITLNPNQFPTTAGARDSICALARANGVTLPDSNALAIEIKTSWVEAKDLPEDVSNYITVDAVVPTYKVLPGDTAWIMDGEKKVKLAMIGMHIVGSVAGHPEMVWATFEHRKNAPNAAYQYVDVKDSVRTVPADTGSKWLLTSNAADPNPNKQQQAWSSKNGVDTIYTTTPGTQFKPSNVLRVLPWGSAMDSVTNPEDKSSAASNSEIISINNAVYNLLPGNDVRKNYWFIGAAWTFGGAAPNGQPYTAADGPAPAGPTIGTSVLANATMETFLQLPATNCFTCHRAYPTPNLLPGQLSHIFGSIVPIKLPNVPPSMTNK